MPLCKRTSSWRPPTNDDGNQTTDACVRKNYEDQAPNATQLQQLQDNRASLERPENADCVKKFHNLYEPEYRCVVRANCLGVFQSPLIFPAIKPTM